MCIRDRKQVKLARMGEVVFGITDGTEEERARKAIVACEDFFRRMGLKTRLGECGIAEKDLDALAAPVDKQGMRAVNTGAQSETPAISAVSLDCAMKKVSARLYTCLLYTSWAALMPIWSCGSLPMAAPGCFTPPWAAAT